MGADQVREILRAGGIPIGAVSLEPLAMPDARDLRSSLSRSPQLLEPHELDAVQAWVAGFQHHWPRAYHRWVGDTAPLPARAMDRDRFVKLRRIAVANLARALNASPARARAE